MIRYAGPDYLYEAEGLRGVCRCHDFFVTSSPCSHRLLHAVHKIEIKKLIIHIKFIVSLFSKLRIADEG